MWKEIKELGIGGARIGEKEIALLRERAPGLRRLRIGLEDVGNGIQCVGVKDGGFGELMAEVVVVEDEEGEEVGEERQEEKVKVEKRKTWERCRKWVVREGEM